MVMMTVTIEVPQCAFKNLSILSITQQTRAVTSIKPLIHLLAETEVIVGFDFE